VREVLLDEDTGVATVIVPDFQLSLAIGKEGQNARLAARLTGWRIDIKSETQLAEEQAYANQDWAEGQWVEDASGEMVWQSAEGGEAISAEDWDAKAAGDNGDESAKAVSLDEPGAAQPDRTPVSAGEPTPAPAPAEPAPAEPAS
jgi:N utilization substance protein A